MSVTLKKEGAVLRKVSAGATSQASRHTFVRIDDKPEVYQTDESFSAELDMSVDSYRDKNICKIKQEDMVSLVLSYRGKTFTFNKGSDEKTDEAVWRLAELQDANLDKNKMFSLVSSLASLKASRFDDSATDAAAQSAAKITIKSNTAELALSIFNLPAKKDAAKEYLVTASDSKYKFIVDEWKIQKFLIDDISAYKAEEKDNK
jgi:hypothetical protein